MAARHGKFNIRKIFPNYRSKPLHNFVVNGYEAGESILYAGAGLIEFNHIGLKKGGIGAVYYSARALAKLYSATFVTAGIIADKIIPGNGNRARLYAAASFGVAATILAGQEGYLSRKPSFLVDSSVPRTLKCKTGNPTQNDYFNKERFDIHTLYNGPYYYNTGLLRDYKNNAQTREYMAVILASADKEGLNPVLFANQLYEETNGFSPSIMDGGRNDKGAIGAGQFKLATAEQYGATLEDIQDWRIAIPLAARHMAALKKKHGGDYILAMIEYNGGPRPIDFVQDKHWPWYRIDGEDWIDYMGDRREKYNKVRYCTHAWHNETFKYVGMITGATWSDIAKILSRRLAEELQLPNTGLQTSMHLPMERLPALKAA